MEKTIKKMFLNKIAEINEMLPQIKNCDDAPMVYDNGTFPFYIELTKRIEVKNQFIYIFEKTQRYNYGFEKRYNVNKAEGLGSREEIIWHLNLIKKTFKAHLKTQKRCIN